MKSYVAMLIFLLTTFTSFSQTQIINSVPKEGIALDKGWKIYTGDNLQFANTAFDDSKWQPVDPGKDITEFNELKANPVCWIRLHIKAGNNISNQLAAWVFQYTASEIYLDGKLVKKYGFISKNTSQTIAYCPAGDLFDLPLKQSVEQVIAVRLAYQKGLPYASPYFTLLPAFSMYVNDFHSAVINNQQTDYFINKALILCGAFAGMVLIISLIYLFYFLFDRKQKVHLYYSISSLFFFLLFLCFTVFVDNIQSVSVQMWTAFIIAIGFVCSSLFMLLTVYTLCNYEKRALFKVLIFAGAGSLAYILFSDITGFIIATNIYMGVCILEGIRANAWAIKNKKKGASVILSGLIIASLLNIWSASIEQSSFFGMTLACLAILAFPLGMSVYLAIQNAITNQALRSTLSEVQTLSEQNILKEQEKQQILSNQNELLEQQVNKRTAELNQSLTELKSTQSQLIQSEKMASLGELTAGIAHEIQNPLNFVNNFSEVNKELIEELRIKNEKLKIEDDEVNDLLNDLADNEEKINHHGKRADSIVKGMLQHSRQTKGMKEPTDINALCDEYLRLSYHGLRAKDKSFNADFKTDFDESLGKINIVPQDIGRVLLNLFNNAFYALSAKVPTTDSVYKPLVSVQTKKINNKIEIIVTDNGNGIPQSIIDKIFQPFFTTKPTGQGTGLGLSLAYDIITKEHNGTIKVESKEGEGSTFIIQLMAA